MGNHRTRQQRRTSRAIAVAATAAGISAGLVAGHATNTTLANLDFDLTAIIGVGGKDNPTSDRVPPKLDGDYTTDDLPAYGNRYILINYPASIQFQDSVIDGVPKLTTAIATDTDPKTRVVSYSEGTLVAEQVKRNLAAQDPENPLYEDRVDFVFIASPYVPNGGLFSRFPGFGIPGFVPQFSAAEPTGYNSTYVYNEYDGISDFPAYFNPLAIANALLGIVYAHPDQYYDDVDVDNLQEGTEKFTRTVDNGADGTDTYIMIYNEHLPLLAPIRQVAAALGLTPFVEPILKLVEPALRVMIDAGYTDRENLHPETPTPFSFITPPAKIAEAAAKLPGAIQEGIEDATGQNQSNISTLSVDNQSNQRSLEKAPEQPEVTNQDNVVALKDTAGDDTDLNKDEDAPKPPAAPKPKPTNPLKEVAKAVNKFLHPTKIKDGNLVKPTTKAGEQTGGNGENKDDTTTSTTPGDPAPGGGAAGENEKQADAA